MNQKYTEVVKEQGGWWICWIEEVPGANCQERTRDALMETLRVTLREALEFHCRGTLGVAPPDPLCRM